MAFDRPGENKGSLALWWLLATLAGLVSGYFLAVSLSYLLERTLPEALVFAMVFAVSGITQWMVLRVHLRQAWWWALASAAGWTVGWAIVWLLQRPPSGLAAFALASLGAGLAQSRVLNRHSRRAVWWLLASPLAWAGGWGAAGMVQLPASPLNGLLLWFLVVGLIAGGITGLTLAFVIRPANNRQ